MLRLRVSVHGYLIAAAVGMTAAVSFLRVGLLDWAIGCAVGVAPILVAAVMDRFEFDGRTFTRRGLAATCARLMHGTPQTIRVEHIESVRTDIRTATMSTDQLAYRFTTVVAAGGAEFVVRSNRRGYIPFVLALFEVVGHERLDATSSGMLKYLRDEAALGELTSEDVASVPVARLREIANGFGLQGKIQIAQRYFTLAYERDPQNPHLLYEMGRFLRAFAAVENPRLDARAEACLRLAARHGRDEPDLLERLGETYSEYSEYERARNCFTRALVVRPALVRANLGLAELALRDGKLAHAAHHYAAAAAAASQRATSNRAQREAEYYERLMLDDDFLEAELGRLRFVNQLLRLRRSSALLFFVAWIGGGLAGRFSQEAESFGWALMGAAALVWFASTLGLRLRRK